MSLIKYFCLLFYGSFLKRKLICDKENMLILNTCNFENKMSNLTCSDLFIVKMCSWRWFCKFCKSCWNMSMTEFTVKEVTLFRVATLWTKHFAKYNFLGIYKIFNITNKLTN